MVCGLLVRRCCHLGPTSVGVVSGDDPQVGTQLSTYLFQETDLLEVEVGREKEALCACSVK